MNPCGGTSKGGRAKIEVAPRLLKAGIGTGAGTASFTFEKPKLNGAPAGGGNAGKEGLILSDDPKSFCSYSCNC